ncbi:MAG: hypothetical protein EOP83_22470 [Verrucomicrobiaceae bacterium]|nr:MAG: hypothetical protein EOP83_22470 [Verrucomicrobiaceae bacterium]
MKPDTPPSWQKLAAVGRKELHRTATSPAAQAEPAQTAIPWLAELGAQVHAGFVRQIWQRWALAGLVVLTAILAYLLLSDRLAPSGGQLTSPRIPIPEAP